MKRKIMLIVACLFVAIGFVTAQHNSVSGVVTSEEDGEPIVGASVLVEGTTLGGVTDIDGKFFIANVPASAKTLKVSYIGMESRQVSIVRGKQMRIALRTDTEMLDEVMVVAFGTAKKSAFTGSASVVNSETISQHVTTNVANTLVGSVPGLQMRGTSGAPGTGSGTIYIRGVASMYANADPLVIVDGAPYTASLSNIPQSDIESVTVLKDAASAALYGARGAAGVILITTKKGNSQDAKITLDMKWGATSRAVQDYDVIKDPAEYLEAYYAQTNNYYLYGVGLDAAAANASANALMVKNLGYPIYTVPDGQQIIGLDGKINPNATLGYSYQASDGNTYYITPDDWTDAAYRTALRQEYNLSASGGSDRASFYASLGYLNEDGILHYSGYERYSGRVKADYQAKNWLKLSANVGYVHSKTISNPNLSSDSYGEVNPAYFTTFIAPIYPLYVRTLDASGNPVIATDAAGNPKYDYSRTANDGFPGYTRAFLSGNPLGANYYNDAYTIGDQLNATFNADINFTSYLKLNLASNVIYGQSNSSMYNTMYYGPSAGTNGSIEKSSTTNIRTNNTQTLSFFKDFGKHNVNLLLGHEYYRTTGKYLYARAFGLFTEDVLEIDAAANKDTSSSYTTNYNVEGYFGSAQYNYAEKYFASASYRRDASSRFAKENRWGNFWSVGGAWILSKENFLSGASHWLDQLKLKASIGQQGNDNLSSNWRFIDLYELVSSGEYTMSPSLYTKGNNNITWETTTKFNLGAEFSLFKGRLSGSVEYYYQKVSDLLFALSVPLSSGYSSYYDNVGDIRNAGIEVQLTGALVRTRDIDWTLSVNASHNSTKILKLPESKIRVNGGFVSSSRWFEEGGDYYNPFRYKYAGVNEQGEALYWVDANVGHNTAKPGTELSYTTTNSSEATYYALGNIYPAVSGGFSTMFRFKNLDIALNFDYQIGGKIYDSRYVSLMAPDYDGSSGYTIHKDWAKSWTPNNTSSTIPRWQYGDQYTASASDRFYTNAGYLNFQSFTVGYTLPKSWLRNSPLGSVRVYAAGENLGFWSARKGLDPRYSFTAGASLAAYNQTTRNISGGIQVTF